jgi:hypothetical protein
LASARAAGFFAGPATKIPIRKAESHARRAQPRRSPPGSSGAAVGGGLAVHGGAEARFHENEVKKMNAAQGQAKVDAIAELLTTLVQQHQSMHGDMGQMMSKTQDKHAGAAAK